MTFEELQEEITSMGLGYSSVDSDDFKGLIVKDKQGREIVRVPVDVVNLFGLKQLLNGCLDWDDESELAQVLNSYMGTPIGKRGLEKRPDTQSFTDRLKEERDELDERRKKLFEFLGSPKFIGLPEEQQELMRLQTTVMEMYLRILERRLNLLHVKYWDDDQGDELIVDPRYKSIFDEDDDDDAD